MFPASKSTQSTSSSSRKALHKRWPMVVCFSRILLEEIISFPRKCVNAIAPLSFSSSTTLLMWLSTIFDMGLFALYPLTGNNSTWSTIGCGCSGVGQMRSTTTALCASWPALAMMQPRWLSRYSSWSWPPSTTLMPFSLLLFASSRSGSVSWCVKTTTVSARWPGVFGACSCFLAASSALALHDVLVAMAPPKSCGATYSPGSPVQTPRRLTVLATCPLRE
mmetsp:Transcript_14060/g.38443  ORF Transcript_14060/g.38443 Transcript_14060/m.38443 type:complete len:221 (-) Transcript_14060:735-1397(-)